MTIPYGPLFPVKILYDNTRGVFQKILGRTKKIFIAGPRKSYNAACTERLKKLDRWFEKLTTYQHDPQINFYYAGIAYEAFIRVWFEQQNLWPLPPKKAFPFIKSRDVRFWKLLRAFSSGQGMKRTRTAKQIIDRIHVIAKKKN